MFNKAIYLDMDGTIASLYDVENWLEKLQAHDASPYEVAAPCLKMQPLARLLNQLQKAGYIIGIISWLSKTSTPEYDEQVAQAKLKWLSVHLKSVQFDEIHIVEYGVPKSTLAKCPMGILFDDNEEIRKEWKGKTYEPNVMLDILRALK